ncbi:MAG: alpha/beta fold hydrolase [Propionibacteriaceae bacterium]|nr:alpha/beta fold hydrolase [Propionibacteriaceae bacterium]
MRHTEVRTDRGDLAVRASGSGEPVLVVQTALAVDELALLMRQESLRDRYRLITFDRRGYGASAATGPAASIGADAQDCLAVLTAMEAAPAHVIGASYSAAVALELAAAAPSAVRTLTIVEPPPRHVPAAAEFLAANRVLLDTFRREGTRVALESFMAATVGPDWRTRQESLAPGSVARIERDAAAFFAGDIPGLVAWEYGRGKAERVAAPVLYVGGTESGPWFDQTRAWASSLFPGLTSVTIQGAGHDLALTHPAELAGAIARFLDA